MSVQTFRISRKLSQIKQNVDNLHPLEIMAQVSETQLKVGENVNYLP